MSTSTEHPRTGQERLVLPVLPLRDVVVFPHMVIPLFVGRDKSIRALDLAMEGDKRILLVAQKSAETDADRRVKFELAAGPHAPRQRHRRQEPAAPGVAVGTDLALPVQGQEVEPVPQRRQHGFEHVVQ